MLVLAISIQRRPHWFLQKKLNNKNYTWSLERGETGLLLLLNVNTHACSQNCNVLFNRWHKYLVTVGRCGVANIEELMKVKKMSTNCLVSVPSINTSRLRYYLCPSYFFWTHRAATIDKVKLNNHHLLWCPSSMTLQWFSSSVYLRMVSPRCLPHLCKEKGYFSQRNAIVWVKQVLIYLPKVNPRKSCR